jgi:uncharacterized membrane protein required for colicin V production
LTDLIIGGGILLSALAGWRSGLIRQIVSLVSLFLAYFLAKSLHLSFAPVIQHFIGGTGENDSWFETIGLSNGLYQGLAFIVLFSVFLFVIRLIGSMLDLVASLPVLSMLNRTGGLLIGFLLGVIIAALVVNVLVLLPQPDLQQALSDSQLARALLKSFAFLLPGVQNV